MTQIFVRPNFVYTGEREAERRDRLRGCLSRLTDEQVMQITGQADMMEALTSTVQVQQTSTFYTEGSPAVKNIRHWIAQYSLRRAQQRIERQRNEKASVPWEVEQRRRSDLTESIGRAANEASEHADERPVSCCSFSAEGGHAITGGWTGYVKVWTTQGLKKILTVKAHEERVTGVAAYPLQNQSNFAAATAAAAVNAAGDSMDVDNGAGDSKQQEGTSSSSLSLRLSLFCFPPQPAHQIQYTQA